MDETEVEIQRLSTPLFSLDPPLPEWAMRMGQCYATGQDTKEL